MNEETRDSQVTTENKIREEAERYLNIYRPVHGHLVLDNQYMKQIKASLEYGLLTRILNDIESVDVDYLNQLIERLGESITADTRFKLSELANAISSVNNHVSSLDIQAIKDSTVSEVLNIINTDNASFDSRLKTLEDNLGNITSYSDDNTKKLKIELTSITDGINSKVSALEEYKITRTADDILQASKISQLEAIYEDNNKRLLARVREESESRIDGYKALTQQLNSMTSQVNNSVSTIDEVKRTYADLERSHSERISTLESSYKGVDTNVKAKLSEHSKTLTEANKALANKVTSLEANIDGKIGAKFNEAIETISTEQEALARKVTELNTSFLGLDGKLEGTIREEIKSVSDANKVQLSKLEELEGKTDTTLGKIESLKKTIVTPEQVTNIVSDEMVAKYSNAKDKILDTRDTNELPRYYYNKYPNALAKEIKLSAVMGIDGEGELGYLETQTIGTNYREGRVTQVFYCEDGDTYKRVSITEDIWNVWKLQETDESAKEKLRLALLEIQQKIIESEARIETYNRTHSDATKALAESLKQLEADYKEGDRVVNSRIVTLEQVQSAVDSAYAGTIEQLNSSLDGVKGSITKLQETVTNPDGTLAVSEDMIRNLILDETKIKETKGVNSTPEWYVNNHLGKTVKELKTSSVIDLTQNGDAYLETAVLSASVSNGSVKQEVVTEDAKVYTRQSSGLSTWSNWVQSENSLTAIARLTEAKEDLERELAKVYSEFTDYKETKTLSDEAEALRVQGLSTKLESDFGTLQGLIRSEETSRLEQDRSINARIDTISSNLGNNYATIRSVNETKSTLEENIVKKGDEIKSNFDNKLIEERKVTNTAIRTSADGVTQALTTKIDEYKQIATNAKTAIDDYKIVNDSAVRALGERNTQLKGEFTQGIVNAKVEMQGVIDTTKDSLLDNIDETKQGLERVIGEVKQIATTAKSKVDRQEETLNDTTKALAKVNESMSARYTKEEANTLINTAKDNAIKKAKEDAGKLIEGATDTLKKYTDAGIDAHKSTQAKENEAFAKQYSELKATMGTLPTTTQVEAKIKVEGGARVDAIQALAKQITKGSVKFPNGTGNTNEVSSALNDIIKATADSTFVDKSATFKATLHREVNEKMFRDAGNLLTDTINYTSWVINKSSAEPSLPRLNDGVWELNGTTTEWKEIMLLSKEGTKLEIAEASESLVQVTEGSEYILEFEAKGNVEIEVFIRTFYTVGSSRRYKQIISVVPLKGTWTKHRVQVKCPELKANEVRDYIGVFFMSESVGSAQIRKPRLYLDPSVLNAAIKEYKQMNLDMKGSLDAKIGLTVDNGNRIIGWTATERNNSSEFNIMADKFKISNSSRTGTPFSIDSNGNITFNGKVSFNSITDKPTIPTQDDVNTWANNQINTQNPVIKGIIDTIPDNSTISKLAKAEADKKDAAINTVRGDLNSRFDSLAVGGRNLLLASATAYSSTAYSTRYVLSQAPAVGDDVVITLWGDLGADRTGIGVYNTQGYNEIALLVKIADGIYQGKGRWQKPMNGTTLLTPNDTHLNVYFYPNSAKSLCRIDRIKLEKGTIATDWTPAPEDVDLSITTAKTEAITEANQTMIDGGRIVTNSITANKINTGAIQTKHIEAKSITVDKIQDANITNAKIADGAITNAKIENGAITNAKIENAAITNVKIADGAITNAKIGNAAISNAKIENGAITTAKIGDAQISNAKIENGAITTAKIGNAQIDTLQIAGEAVIIPRLQYSDLQEFYEIDTEVEVNRVSLNAQGGAVSISFGFESLEFRARNTKSNDGAVKMRIKRGNTVLRYKEFRINYGTTKVVYDYDGDPRVVPDVGYGSYGQTIFLTFLDVPPPGEQVYTITLESRRLNDGLSSRDRAAHPVKIHERSLHIMGVKR